MSTKNNLEQKEKDENYYETHLRDNEYQIGQVILKHYKIIKMLARGGMSGAPVYLAEDIDIKDDEDFRTSKLKNVCIKSVKRKPKTDEETQEDYDYDWTKFCHEVVTLERLKSAPHIKYIAEIFDKAIFDDEIIIVMEYVKGKCLDRVIREQGCLSLEEALMFFKKILYVIEDLHKSYGEPIIHRDLKGDNIMISDDWTEVKIIDFGTATSYQVRGEVAAFRTIEYGLWGTGDYTTPQALELIEHGLTLAKKEEIIKKIGFQFDFFSLGVIFYKMLMGELPYKYKDDDGEGEKIAYSINYDIPLISKVADIPQEAENIILKLMASKNINTNKMLIKYKGANPVPLPDDYVHQYNDISEVIDDVNRLEENYKNNNFEELNEPLLKSFDERRFQDDAKIFPRSLEKEPFYDKAWFFITFVGGSLIIMLIMTFTFLFA
ncbi:MAG: hypothetical protein Ta2E_05270 [Mycoplasmoidaceae bacterium]|nr:MAG: hypothetical protein Ta2E_05270 [Mycoplasmoidaceae bacterium]